MRNQVIILLTILCAAILYSCKTTEEKSSEITKQQFEEIRSSIIDWMECEECSENQLERVVKQGEIVVPSLSAILIQGPSPAKIKILEDHLATSYQDLLNYAETHPENKPTISREDYIQSYLDNYKALYRSRAAIALGEIGGNEAKAALDNAANIDFREDVNTTIKDAIEKF